MEFNHKLSVIMITGTCRKRAQYALSQLDAQKDAGRFEIIIVDLAGDKAVPFNAPLNHDYVYIVMPKTTTWGQARKAAVKKASGEIIAFIEDHCFAEVNWAKNLIAAFADSPWAAIGYAIKNANPQTWSSRAGLVADYILWMHPITDGEANLLPGNNVAYRSEFLLPIADRLPLDLGCDFNIHEYLHEKGLRLAMSADTIALHQNYDNLHGLLNANFYYCRMLAANRVKAQQWGNLHRWLYILGVPLGAPVIKMYRILKSLKTRKELHKEFILALPVITITFFISAIGEALGYLVGAGNAAQDFNTWELFNQRTDSL